CPGWVDTDMAWQGIDLMAEGMEITRDAAYAEAMREVPLGRMGTRPTSPGRTRGYFRPTLAASRGRRSTRTAARSCFERTMANAVVHAAAASTNGIQSPVAAAIAPPAAGPTSAPVAQAAVMKPKAMPCARRAGSAPSASSANAGVKSAP